MKKFLIIGNGNAVKYKEIFPLIKDNKMWLGVNNGVVNFITGDSVKDVYIYWFTNLEHNKQRCPIELTKHYSPDSYYKYLNYNAINVDKVKDIPMDYDGIMGVPISFLNKYCPEQFEIVGCPAANVVPEGWKRMSKSFVDLYYAQGGTGQYQEGKRLEHYTKDGNAIIPYSRILIKRKDEKQKLN